MKHQNNLIISIPCFILISFFVNACTIRQENAVTDKTIVVTGSAEMEILPDEIYVTYTLKEYLDQTKKKVNLDKVKNDFLTACKSIGIADSNISISNFQGNESWDYHYYRKRRREPDFMATLSYMIKFNAMDQIEKLATGLNENSVQNYNITRTAHSNIQQLRKQVKINAVKASKDKATYLAEGIGEEIKEALSIQEIKNDYNGDRVVNMYSNSKMEDKESAQESNISFEKIKIRYEINASYRLK